MKGGPGIDGDRSHLRIARDVLATEVRGIEQVGARLGPEFDRALELILACRGKVIVTGMGKSGHVASKIASTFSSTGTSAVYVHPGEGMHGDLGVIAASDVVLALSYSGNSPEIMAILPSIRRIGAPLIAMTGRIDSALATAADVVLDVRVDEEACPLGLAPTASTTASLALGDALAVAALTRRGFSAEDFALFHPGGALGKRLLLRTADLMSKGDKIPRVSVGCSVLDAVMELSAKRMGIIGVFEGEDLIGCFTDGDLRRGLQEHRTDLFDLRIDDVMTRNPRTIPSEIPAVDALRLMETARIWVLFVTEPENPKQVVGVLHMHELLREGLE